MAFVVDLGTLSKVGHGVLTSGQSDLLWGPRACDSGDKMRILVKVAGSSGFALVLQVSPDNLNWYDVKQIASTAVTPVGNGSYTNNASLDERFPANGRVVIYSTGGCSYIADVREEYG